MRGRAVVTARNICPGKCGEQGKGGGDEVVAQTFTGLAEEIYRRPDDEEQDKQSCQRGGDGGVSDKLEDVLRGEHGLSVVRHENKTPPRTHLPVGVFGWGFCLSVAPDGVVVVPWGCHLRRP